MNIKRLLQLVSGLDNTERRILYTALVLALLAGIGSHFWFSSRSAFQGHTRYLPYEFKRVSLVVPPEKAYDGYTGPGFGLVDYEGKGPRAFVKSGKPGVTAFTVSNGRYGGAPWQYNPESKYAWALNCGAVYGGYDTDADGREDVVLVFRTQDGSDHQVVAYDPKREIEVGKVNLPGGKDRRIDGVWDGSYFPIGTLTKTSSNGEQRQVLIVGCKVRFDAYGRGIYAVDLSSGEILWSYLLGGSPRHDNAILKDLDGDGRTEIILGTNSPDNLGREIINGSCDQQSLVAVLNDDGSLRWSRVTGIRACSAEVFLAEGKQENTWDVISVTTSPKKPLTEITRWNGDTGQFLHQRVNPFNCMRTGTHFDKDGNLGLLMGRLEGGMHRYGLSPNEVFETDYITTSYRTNILKTGDWLPDPGQETLVGSSRTGLFLLGSDLKVLAAHMNPGNKGFGQPVMWKIGPDETYLLSANPEISCLLLTKRNPLTSLNPYPALSSAGLFLAITGVGFLRRRNRNLYHMRVDLNDPDILREMRLRLLSDLELSGHGAVGVLKSLRRLVWNLETRSVGLGNSEEMTQRLQTRRADFSQSVLPHIQDILGLAEKCQTAEGAVARVNEALNEAEQILSTLARDNFQAEQIHSNLETLQDCSDEAEKGLKTLRRTVEDLFRSDLLEVWALVLRSRQDDLEKAGVGVVQNRAQGQIIGRLDPKQLEFMLDNLVGNGIRAMVESSNPQITINIQKEDGFVVCDVSDTGWGIEPEDWDRVMDTPYSSRRGGGLGLFETQRLLRLYGGGISIKESHPGAGTTIRLLIPEAKQREPGSA